MNKKNKIMNILFFSLMGIMVLFCIIHKLHPILHYIAIGFIIAYFVFCFIVIFLMVYEKIKMQKQFKRIEKNIDLEIDLCQRIIQTYFVYAYVRVCQLKLGICYLMKGELDLASSRLKDFNSNYQPTFYPNFILAVLQEDKEKMLVYYEKLMACKKPFYEEQKRMATLIKEMVETKKFSEEVYLKTKYPSIRELCLNYKE